MTSPTSRSITLVLILISALIAPVLCAAENPVVTGTFLGDGKDGNIKFLVVENREPFSDKPAIRLVFTEKDPSKSKKPGWDAGFKKLGSALILSVNRDGDIFGCEVAHSVHEKSPFSALGKIKMTDFKVTGATVSGHVTTGGEDDAFGQKWNVDLEFSAQLPAGAFAAPAPTPEPTAVESREAVEPSGPRPQAKEIPIPASAENVQTKPLVGQISFRSSNPVSSIAKEFSDTLKSQGWKEGQGGLASKSNTILVRERDGATLTIMIQAAGTGSSVRIMSQGLDWTESPDALSGEAEPEPKDAEAEANKLLQDALKMIPGSR